MCCTDRSDAALADPSTICRGLRELLSDYVVIEALGETPPRFYPGIATHLASCAACRDELDELRELVLPAYADAIAPAPEARPAWLPFERAVGACQRWIIEFSQALLAGWRPAQLAGATRGQLLHRYVQDAAHHGIGVTIETFAEDAARGIGRVRVGIDQPGRDPLDQGGCTVELSAGVETWQAQTDDTGTVDFNAVPLAALPRLRIAIIPAAPPQ